MRIISEIFLLYVYVCNNVFDKYENNLLYVNIKLWYEFDDKVVFKEIKKKIWWYIFK